jgi:hypothetical protein
VPTLSYRTNTSDRSLKKAGRHFLSRWQSRVRLESCSTCSSTAIPAMLYSLLPLAVRTIPLKLIDAILHLNADSYLFPCLVGLIGIPGGTGSIFVSRLSTAWHVAKSTIPRNTPTASAGAGVFIAQSRHPRHDKPSPHTVMLVLLLVAMPVGLFYFLVLRISTWLAASFTFSMLALIFLCIAVRLPSPFLSTHLPFFFFGRSPCR